MSLSSTAFFHGGSHLETVNYICAKGISPAYSQGSLHASVFSEIDPKKLEPLPCMNTVAASRLAHHEELPQLYVRSCWIRDLVICLSLPFYFSDT